MWVYLAAAIALLLAINLLVVLVFGFRSERDADESE